MLTFMGRTQMLILIFKWVKWYSNLNKVILFYLVSEERKSSYLFDWSHKSLCWLPASLLCAQVFLEWNPKRLDHFFSLRPPLTYPTCVSPPSALLEKQRDLRLSDSRIYVQQCQLNDRLLWFLLLCFTIPRLIQNETTWKGCGLPQIEPDLQ